MCVQRAPPTFWGRSSLNVNFRTDVNTSHGKLDIQKVVYAFDREMPIYQDLLKKPTEWIKWNLLAQVATGHTMKTSITWFKTNSIGLSELRASQYAACRFASPATRNWFAAFFVRNMRPLHRGPSPITVGAGDQGNVNGFLLVDEGPFRFYTELPWFCELNWGTRWVY